jgi:ketosteroid isomerase-like protein
MTTPLPSAIDAYFAAAGCGDADALLGCFTADAVVFDENYEPRLPRHAPRRAHHQTRDRPHQPGVALEEDHEGDSQGLRP